MTFEEIWQQYNFTESELLSMGWQLPDTVSLHLNYYISEWGQVAEGEQPLTLALQEGIRLSV